MWSAIWGGITDFFGGFESQLITIAAIVAVLIGGWLYWEHLETKISTLTQQNNVLTATVKTQDQTIAQLQQRFTQEQQQLNDLNKKYLTTDANENVIKKQFEYGVINSGNKKTVETNVNQSYNGIFQNIMTTSSTFSSGTQGTTGK
jgi:cell division protein FtsB